MKLTSLGRVAEMSIRLFKLIKFCNFLDPLLGVFEDFLVRLVLRLKTRLPACSFLDSNFILPFIPFSYILELFKQPDI